MYQRERNVGHPSPADRDEIDISIGKVPGGVAITVHGELDFTTAQDLVDAVCGATTVGVRSIAINLSGVTFVSAYALRAIADTAVSVGLAGGRLTVRSPSPWVRHVLIASRLGCLINDDFSLAGAPASPSPTASLILFDR